MISCLRLLIVMLGLWRDGLVYRRHGEWKLTPRGRLYANDILTAERIVAELTPSPRSSSWEWHR